MSKLSVELSSELKSLVSVATRLAELIEVENMVCEPDWAKAVRVLLMLLDADVSYLSRFGEGQKRKGGVK